MGRENIRKIHLNNAKKVFPDKYTKVRLEDLRNLTVEKSKYLTKKEKETLQGFSQDSFYNGNNFEFIAERNGNIIKLVPIDD